MGGTRRSTTGRVPTTATLILSMVLLVGLVSAPAAASGPVFADGFETGSLVNWTRANDLVVQQQEVLSGSHAARGVNGASWAFKRFPETYGELYARTAFKVVSQETHVTILRLRTASGPPILQVFLNAKGRVVVRNDVAKTKAVSSSGVQPGAWHDVQVRLRVGGSGRADVWLNGAPLADVSGPGAFGSEQIGRLEIGNRPQNRVYDVVFDEVVADVEPISEFPGEGGGDNGDGGDPSAGGLPSVLPDKTWHTDGQVRAIARVGDVVYIGGSFSQLREKPVGESGGVVIPVANLAALDAATGRPVGYSASTQTTTFNPMVTGSNVMIHTLAHAGGKLFVGGRFGAVAGQARKNLAAVDPGTGAVDPSFQPNPAGIVWGSDTHGSQLYVGGAFTKMNRQDRRYLAALGFGGTLDPLWTPSADARVREVAVIPGGSGIFVGGHFATVRSASGGPWHERQSIARLTMAGQVDTGWEVNRRISSNNWGIDVLPHPPTGHVYVGTGGSDWVGAFDIDTGRQSWRTDTNGSAQAVAVMGDRVVVGGHYKWIQRDPRSSSCGTHGSDSCENRLRLAALHLDGFLDMDWVPSVTGHYNGVWALLVTDGESRVWLGGEFKRITGVKQSYVGRLS